MQRSIQRLKVPTAASGTQFVLLVASLLLLAACGRQPAVETSIRELTAVPLTEGDGAWRVSWDVTGAGTVEFDGDMVSNVGARVVRPGQSTTYTLTAGTAGATITLAPVSGVSVIGATDSVVAGESIALAVTVTAAGSDVEPSQAVVWNSSAPDVASVDPGGIVTAIAEGTVTITASSSQDTSVSGDIELAVQAPPDPVILAFTAPGDTTGLEAGDNLVLEWSAAGFAALAVYELVPTGVLDGDGNLGEELRERQVALLEADAGSLGIALPGDKREVNYLLRAVNSVGVEVTEILWDVPLSLPGWVCQDAYDVITFADAFIETQVRSIWNTRIAGAADIVCDNVRPPEGAGHFARQENEFGQEMHSLIEANRCDQDDDPIIEDLEGIQHLIYLLRLELECNEITDISRLASLTALEELNLDFNDLSDIGPLAGMSEMRVLGFYQNDVSDITALAGMQQLEILYMSENRIRDLSPLAALTSLQHVWMYMNCDQIHYDPADPDTVVAWSGCLDDLSPLAGLHGLVSVVFHQNEVADLGFISADMTELALVFASGNRLTDVAPLEQLPALVTARLDGNLIAGLGPLAANTDFTGDESPYSWQRGTVHMPPLSVGPAFAEHLSLHYNCLDTADATVIADHDAILARGVLSAGFSVAQHFGTRCDGLGVAQAGAVTHPEGYLRELARFSDHR